MGKDFGPAFRGAKKVYLLDIYPAGERPMRGVSSAIVEKSLRRSRVPVEYLGDRGELLERVVAETKPGEILATLGAGDVSRIGPEFLEVYGRG